MNNLAAGFWFLATSSWLLAAGHWLLVSSIIQKILLQTKFMKPQKFQIRTTNIYLVTNKPKARGQ